MTGTHELETRKNRGYGLLPFILLALLAMTAFVPLLAGSSSAQAIPYPMRGYVFDDQGDPVEDATVTCLAGTATTDVTGWWLIDGGSLGIDDGDTLTIAAVKTGVGVDSISHTVDYAADPDNLNLTLEEVSLDLFTVTFFCFDADGLGVANVTIQVEDALGTLTNLTTNSTGIATSDLADGLFSWTAITNATQRAAGLLNQTGEFTIDGLNLAVNIDMSVLSSIAQNLLGYAISDNCLFIFAVGVVLFGLAIFAVHQGGKMKNGGAMSGKNIVALALIALVVVIVLFSVNSGSTLDLSVSGVLDLLGFDLGSVIATTDAVLLFLMVCATAVGAIVATIGGLAKVSALQGKTALGIGLFQAGVMGLLFLLVPGFTTIALYAFVLGMLCIVGLVLMHLFKPKIDNETGSYATIALGVAIGLLVVYGVYQVVGATAMSISWAITFVLIVGTAAAAMFADQGFKSVDSTGRKHLWMIFAGLGVVVLGFAIYGAVKVAVDANWMIVNLIRESWQEWALGFLVVGAIIIFAMLVMKKIENYRAWAIFTAVMFIMLASLAYLYWYKVVPYVETLAIGNVFAMAMTNPAGLVVAVTTAIVASLAFCGAFKLQKMNGTAAQGSDSMVRIGAMIVLVFLTPFVINYLNTRYDPSEFVRYFEMVGLVVVGYVGCKALELHKK